MLQRLKVPNNLLRTSFKRFPCIALAPPFRQLRTRRTESRPEDTLKKLLPSIKSILSLVADDEENSGRWVHSVLDSALKNTASPHRVYEEVISFLVLNKNLEHALSVFERMQNAGFTPSNAIVSQMMAPVLSPPNLSIEPVAREMVQLLVDPEYTDEHLSTLLRIFTKYDVGHSIVAPIVDCYRSSQDPDYVPLPRVLSTIVTSAARMGNLEEAFDLLTRGSQKTRNAVERNEIFSAFVNLLDTLRVIRTWDDLSFAHMTDLITAQGWLVNIRVFDALLSREVRNGSPRVALTIYSLLKDLSKTHSIRPSAGTFGTLFTLYRGLSRKAYQQFYRGQSPILLPMRRLFQEFHGFVTREKNPLVPSTSLLNAALRAFLRHRDYAGAFAVLDCFSLYKVPLDHKTYHSVMKLIVRRIWYEISGKRKEGTVRWADRFLGASYHDVDLCVSLVNHLLVVVSQDKFKLTDPIYPPDGEFRGLRDDMGRYKVPTLLMMEHKYRPDPWDFYYEHVPLKRILHRAIMAEDPSGSLAESFPIIVKARTEMLSP